MNKRKILGFIILMWSFNLFSQDKALSNYEIVSLKDYFSKAKQKKYIVVPCDIKSYKLNKQDNNPDYVISWAFYLCINEKSNDLVKYIRELTKSSDKGDSIADLLNGIYYFYHDNFAVAITSFDKYNGSKYLFLKYLLIADSKYEMLVDKYDWPNLIADYQKAYDNTQKTEYKKLITDRILCARYQR
jgi:hypothetical protein